MHYTGTIWRPPYEAASLLLEATIGCTHHNCKFCTLYYDLPIRFKAADMATIKSDLIEAQTWLFDPIGLMSVRLQGLGRPNPPRRVFLTGANPFVLSYDRLMSIAELIHTHLPSVKTIGAFARVTDITAKSAKELVELQKAGYNGLTIGMETGDDKSLEFMRKGYTSADILTQCQKLDEAGIAYAFFYLTGIGGAGGGEKSATATAEICNKLHPRLIGPNMLTVYPDSDLYKDILKGNWREAGEIEKYREVRLLLSLLDIPTEFAMMGASNAYILNGTLPNDREALLASLDEIIETAGENRLKKYRRELRHL